MSYAKRLKDLGNAWKKEKPASGGGMDPLPDGKYQFKIERAQLIKESKAPFALGEPEISFMFSVLTGPHKNRKAFKSVFITQESKGNIPSGIAQLKGICVNLGIEMPKALSEKSLNDLLKSFIGVAFNGACKANAKGYVNVYINDAIHSSDEDDEDDEDDKDEYEDIEKDDDEDDDEDENEEDDEEDDGDDDEEDPPVKKKKSSRKSAKKPVESDDDDEDEDDDDWDLDD